MLIAAVGRVIDGQLLIQTPPRLPQPLLTCSGDRRRALTPGVKASTSAFASPERLRIVRLNNLSFWPT